MITIARPCRWSSPSRCMHLVPGAHVDPGRRLVEQEQLGLGSSARARNTRCCWPPDSSRMWRAARSPMREALEDRRRRRRARAAGPGQPPAGGAGHQHALGDGDGEVPVDGLDLRHVAEAQARAAPHPAAHRPTVPRSAQQRGLARARRADHAQKGALLDARGRRRRARLAAVAHETPSRSISSALTAGTRRRRAASRGRSSARARPRRRRAPRSWSRSRSAAARTSECSAIAGSSGRSSSRSTST